MTLFMRDEEKREEGRQEGLEKGRAEGKLEAVRRLIDKNQTKEFILDLGYTEEEYQQAKNASCV